MPTGWLIFLGLVNLYILFIFWLVRTGRMEKWDLSLMLGFVLMIRTQRGKKTLEFLSRPARLWGWFGDLGIVTTLVGMAAMTLFMLLLIPVVLNPASGVEPLAASEILVIPGVNPFVPLWYGIIALIITLVVHEGGHGVLALSQKMRVKSLGLLFAIVPIGAFVEPDEEDLKATSRRKRLQVFAAGPMVNLVVAGIVLGGFAGAIAAAEPVEGAAIATLQGIPAQEAGIEPGDVIVAAMAGPVAVQGTSGNGTGGDGTDNATGDGSGNNTGDGTGNGTADNGTGDAGDGTESGPLQNATRQPVPITDWDSFRTFMADTSPGQNVTFTLRDGDVATATLTSRWNNLDEADQEAIFDETPSAMAFCTAVLDPAPQSGGECAERLQQDAFLGVGAFQTAAEQERLANPVSGLDHFLILISLPIGEVRGQPYMSFYLPTFLEAPIDEELYWPTVNLLFWVFWINLMVGLTNILPMLPLDGGHIFRDAVGGVVGRVRPKMDPQRRDRLVGRAAAVVSLVIFGAFLLQIFGPRLVPLFA